MGDMLGREIRRIRGNRSLAVIAKAARISVPFLSDVENGNRGMSGDSAERLAAALGVELAEIEQGASLRRLVRDFAKYVEWAALGGPQAANLLQRARSVTNG